MKFFRIGKFWLLVWGSHAAHDKKLFPQSSWKGTTILVLWTPNLLTDSSSPKLAPSVFIPVRIKEKKMLRRAVNSTFPWLWMNRPSGKYTSVSLKTKDSLTSSVNITNFERNYQRLSICTVGWASSEILGILINCTQVSWFLRTPIFLRIYFRYLAK